MSAQITYKGTSIANFTNVTRTLTTQGKYLEDDITITDTTPVITLQDVSVTPTQTTQTIQADEGYTGLGTVTVNPIPNNYGLITYDGSKLTIS